MLPFEIKAIVAADTWFLRRLVLRPHLPLEESRYPEDLTRKAIHMGVLVGGLIVGIASVYQEDETGMTDNNVWRLRGMAIAPEVRGQGYGRRLLVEISKKTVEQGGLRIWCNARVTAVDFYKQQGFATHGEPFNLADIGAHYIMKKTLTGS